MWDYLFFFYHLDSKRPTEFTFIEQYVAEKLLNNELDFFPIGKALGLHSGPHAISVASPAEATGTRAGQDDTAVPEAGAGSSMHTPANDQVRSAMAAALAEEKAARIAAEDKAARVMAERDKLQLEHNTTVRQLLDMYTLAYLSPPPDVSQGGAAQPNYATGVTTTL